MLVPDVHSLLVLDGLLDLLWIGWVREISSGWWDIPDGPRLRIYKDIEIEVAV